MLRSLHHLRFLLGAQASTARLRPPVPPVDACITSIDFTYSDSYCCCYHPCLKGKRKQSIKDITIKSISSYCKRWVTLQLAGAEAILIQSISTRNIKTHHRATEASFGPPMPSVMVMITGIHTNCRATGSHDPPCLRGRGHPVAIGKLIFATF